MMKFGSNTDLEHNLGKMVPNMKDTGKMIKYRGRESLVMLMEIFMKVNLLQVKQTEMVHTPRKEEKCIKVL